MKRLNPKRPLLSEKNRDYLLLVGELYIGDIETLAEFLMRDDFDQIVQKLTKRQIWDKIGEGIEIPELSVPFFGGRKGVAGMIEGIQEGKWTKCDILNDISQLYGKAFGLGRPSTTAKAEKEARAWEQKLLNFCQKNKT